MPTKARKTPPSSSGDVLRLITHLLQKPGLTTLSAVQVFLLIARREGSEGVLVRDIVRASGLTQSAVARIVAALSDQPARGQRVGLNWLEQKPDPEDPRRVRIHVTEQGHQVLSEIETIMN